MNGYEEKYIVAGGCGPIGILIKRNEKMGIIYVSRKNQKGCPLVKRRIHVGDQLISIDDQRVAELDCKGCVKLLSVQKIVKVIFQRKGEKESDYYYEKCIRSLKTLFKCIFLSILSWMLVSILMNIFVVSVLVLVFMLRDITPFLMIINLCFRYLAQYFMRLAQPEYPKTLENDKSMTCLDSISFAFESPIVFYSIVWSSGSLGSNAIGIKFRQVRFKKKVVPMVESVCRDVCCMALEEICIGDILVELNGRMINTMAQTTKIRRRKRVEMKFRKGPLSKRV